MTDRDGDIIQHYGNSPFGKEHYKKESSAFAPPVADYTSQIIDEDTGLYYYNARYYDPELARFIQSDTILPGLCSQSLNRCSEIGVRNYLFQ